MLKNTEKREENLVLHNLLSICVYNYLITVPVIHIRRNLLFIKSFMRVLINYNKN
jgi:hypothetical protein